MADMNIPPRRIATQERQPVIRAGPGCERACPVCTVQCATIVRARNDIREELSSLSRQLAAADAAFLRISPAPTQVRH